MKTRLTALFASKPRAHWVALFDDTDDCVWPVLDLDAAPQHPHNQARQNFLNLGGVTQPAPAPRFSRTPGAVSKQPPLLGEDSRSQLARFGLSEAEIARLAESGVITQNN